MADNSVVTSFAVLPSKRTALNNYRKKELLDNLNAGMKQDKEAEKYGIKHATVSKIKKRGVIEGRFILLDSYTYTFAL